jgi:hypothetical protein
MRPYSTRAAIASCIGVLLTIVACSKFNFSDLSGKKKSGTTGTLGATVAQDPNDSTAALALDSLSLDNTSGSGSSGNAAFAIKTFDYFSATVNCDGVGPTQFKWDMTASPMNQILTPIPPLPGGGNPTIVPGTANCQVAFQPSQGSVATGPTDGDTLQMTVLINNTPYTVYYNNFQPLSEADANNPPPGTTYYTGTAQPQAGCPTTLTAWIQVVQTGFNFAFTLITDPSAFLAATGRAAVTATLATAPMSAYVLLCTTTQYGPGTPLQPPLNPFGNVSTVQPIMTKLVFACDQQRLKDEGFATNSCMDYFQGTSSTMNLRPVSWFVGSLCPGPSNLVNISTSSRDTWYQYLLAGAKPIAQTSVNDYPGLAAWIQGDPDFDVKPPSMVYTGGSSKVWAVSPPQTTSPNAPNLDCTTLFNGTGTSVSIGSITSPTLPAGLTSDVIVVTYNPSDAGPPNWYTSGSYLDWQSGYTSSAQASSSGDVPAYLGMLTTVVSTNQSDPNAALINALTGGTPPPNPSGSAAPTGSGAMAPAYFYSVALAQDSAYFLGQKEVSCGIVDCSSAAASGSGESSGSGTSSSVSSGLLDGVDAAAPAE